MKIELSVDRRWNSYLWMLRWEGDEEGYNDGVEYKRWRRS